MQPNIHIIANGAPVSNGNPLPVSSSPAAGAPTQAALDAKLAALQSTLLSIYAELRVRAYVTLPAGASKTLATDTSYSGTITGNTTFVLPSVSDGSPHEIWLSLVVTGAPVINLAATKWFTAAQTITAGQWRIGWVWEQSTTQWTVGAFPIVSP